MIINLRGTGGSGKSTVVRRIMELYPEKEPIHVPKRKQPLYYKLKDDSRPFLRPLAVIGHYETPCGGCDTITKIDEVYDAIGSLNHNGFDVLYEGIIVQDDIRRCIEVHRNYPGAVIVIGLTTNIDTCLASIQARRDARADVRLLNPANTLSRAKRVKQRMSSLKDAGVKTEWHDREGAYLRVKELLQL